MRRSTEFEQAEEIEKEKARALLDEIVESKILDKIREEQRAIIIEKRKVAAGKIEKLSKEWGQAISKLKTDLNEKEERFKELKASLDVATKEFLQAKQALTSRNFQLEGIIKEQENFLITSADTAIGEAIQYFNEKLNWLRKPGRTSHSNVGAEKNLISWKKTTREASNYQAVLSALRYCQDSIKELGNMKLVPVLDVEKIEKMKKAVPSIDVYTEYTGEKSMPK